MRQIQAIPFTKPPVGALRFQPPVLTTTLAGGNFDATNFGPACIQTVRVSDILPTSLKSSVLIMIRMSGSAVQCFDI